jgi:hypothetical protein
MGRVTTSTADLWHHYGRARAASDRAVPQGFYWAWGQDAGPDAEVLGDLVGRCVGDLGAGAARHAAHLAVQHQPARVTAVDASPAQCAMASDLYGYLAPRLHIAHCDVVSHLNAMRGMYDVLYSIFGAVDFADPRGLLPTAAAGRTAGVRDARPLLERGACPAGCSRGRGARQDAGRRGGHHAPLGIAGARVDQAAR